MNISILLFIFLLFVPLIGQWVPCNNSNTTNSVCGSPSHEMTNSNDILMYRFPNGTVVYQNTDGSPVLYD